MRSISSHLAYIGAYAAVVYFVKFPVPLLPGMAGSLASKSVLLVYVTTGLDEKACRLIHGKFDGRFSYAY